MTDPPRDPSTFDGPVHPEGDPSLGEGLELLDRRTQLLDDDPESASVAAVELHEVTKRLAQLLSAGTPVVRRVTDTSGLAARLARLEAVHPVTGPDDLADRLDVDRRCYVIEHPALPGRPINVVWVALCHGVPGDVSVILDPTAEPLDPDRADVAAFYSIWNIEDGLTGLGRGEELLLGATSLLSAEFPGLEAFVTLSPIPGFRRWMERAASGPHRRNDVADLVERLERATGAAVAWWDDRDAASELREPLIRLCAEYLTTLYDGWRPIDPVSRFHLGNGARLIRLNWQGDLSERGLLRSYGIMANYRYVPENREANRAQLGLGSVPVSDEVAALL